MCAVAPSAVALVKTERESRANDLREVWAGEQVLARTAGPASPGWSRPAVEFYFGPLANFRTMPHVSKR